MRLPSRFPDPNEPIDNRNSEGHVQIPKNNIPVAGGPLTRGRQRLRAAKRQLRAQGQHADRHPGRGADLQYFYPGATYPFGMVQFTPTYFAKRGGFVINQLSGGGCSHMGNFPTFPVTGKLDSSPENILDYRRHSQAHCMPATMKPIVQERRSRRSSPSPSARAWPAMNTPRGRRAWYLPRDQWQRTAATPIEQAAVVITGPNSCGGGWRRRCSFCGVRTVQGLLRRRVRRAGRHDGHLERGSAHPRRTFRRGERIAAHHVRLPRTVNVQHDRRFVRLGGERPRKPRGRKRRVGFRGRAARRRTEVERLPGADRGRRHQPRPARPSSTRTSTAY